MSAAPAIACPHCGKRYAMTPEYVARYGGRTTACAKCGNPVMLPRSWDEVVPPDPAAPPPPDAPPRQPPSRRPPADAAAEVYRDDDPLFVVARKGAAFPCRCLTCNASAGLTPAPVILSWVPPERRSRLAFTAFMGGAIAGALATRASIETITVQLYSCPRHRPPRDFKTPAACAILVAFIGFVLASVFQRSPYFTVLVAWPIPVLIVGLALAVVRFPLRIVAVEKGFVWIEGFPKSYRKGLPSAAAVRDAHFTDVAARIQQITE